MERFLKATWPSRRGDLSSTDYRNTQATYAIKQQPDNYVIDRFAPAFRSGRTISPDEFSRITKRTRAR